MQRYDPDSYTGQMCREDDGDWVRYADHLAALLDLVQREEQS
jgi:hypothetical protein